MDRQTNSVAGDQNEGLLTIVSIRAKNCIPIGLYSSQRLPLRYAKIRFVAAPFFVYIDFPYSPSIPFYPGFLYCYLVIRTLGKKGYDISKQ